MDNEFKRLAGVLADEDAAWLALHNAHARPSGRLYTAPGPVPFLGALATAPVVLLLSHPEVDADTSPHDYRFAREGWPLAALHPDAPMGLARRWGRRLAPLVRLFGAQHVAHSVAAVFLSPWPSVAFDVRLEFPSRRTLYGLVARAADRDAAFVIGPDADGWFESPIVAELPATRRSTTFADASEELDAGAIGVDAWELLRARIEVHAWL
ncbi:MAG: hypothetical protein ACHQJ7_06990 [Vicinamibacteria bacterium]